jgi:L-fucose isomerase-like protein
MRKPKALVIPFRFREGYPDEIVDQQVSLAVSLLGEMALDIDLAGTVITNKDADLVTSTFVPNNYDFTILLVPTWIEPNLVIRAFMPFSQKPVIVWGFGTFMHEGERVNLGSMPGSGVVKGTLREMGIPHEYLYQLPGDPVKDEKVKSKIRQVANVARAISLLEKSRIVSIGYLFGGMAIGDIDFTKMRTVFGPEIVEMDSYTLISRMEALDKTSQEFALGLDFVQKHLSASIGEKLERITRMYVVLRQIVDENQAQAITLKCHFELSQQYGLTACVPLSVLGNDVVAGCEADIPVLLTQMVMHYLSSGETSTYADIHEILEDRVLVAACGYAPSGMCIGNKIICDQPCAAATGLGATFKDYITNKNYFKQGRVTFGRFLKERDGGFTLHFTTGQAVGDVGRVTELGAPQYPFTEIVLDAPIESFSQNLGSHHYAITYANISADLELFCKYKNINILHE